MKDENEEPYKILISRKIIDIFGTSLRANVSAVISDLIANAYDADAERVTVRVPLNAWLTSEADQGMVDRIPEISVEDDGRGMTRDEIRKYYLTVGVNRRVSSKSGLTASVKQRLRMGRKGIGALAPFGICRIIEVKSAGGAETPQGYLTSHFVSNYDEISEESFELYSPKPGMYDGTYSKRRGTTIKLRNFLYRRTPDAETFNRQLTRRFALERPDFRIEVIDTEMGKSFVVGQLPIDIVEDTKIVLDDKPVILNDGTKLPVRGWVAYAKRPYPNEEFAGVRIYARGRLASCTQDFGIKGGFAGSLATRSYLVGIVHADWLDSDEGEDLIRTDRQDILWDSEVGSAFQRWGQELIKELGRRSWPSVREKALRDLLDEMPRVLDSERMKEIVLLGQMALTRIDLIGKLESALSSEVAADEFALQGMLEAAPWLINPQWTLLQANRTFENMRSAFERWYRNKYGFSIRTSSRVFRGKGRKRPDFIMMHVGRSLEIVEIKKPGHRLTDPEFECLFAYFKCLTEFLKSNEQFKQEFPKPHITLICDGLTLSDTITEAYKRLKEHNNLTKRTWEELLMDTRKTWEELLNEAHQLR